MRNKPKCNKKAMRAWIKALRGGGFKQCRGTLRSTQNGISPKYCCLGVATKVYMRETGSKYNWNMQDSTGGVGQQSKASYLPIKVQKWLGITTLNPMFLGKLSKPVTASTANDSLLWSFRAIATALEKEYF